MNTFSSKTKALEENGYIFDYLKIKAFFMLKDIMNTVKSVMIDRNMYELTQKKKCE